MNEVEQVEKAIELVEKGQLTITEGSLENLFELKRVAILSQEPHRSRLIRDLAREVPVTTLQAKFQVPAETFDAFAKRWAYQVAEAKENPDNLYLGLWIADKRDRIAIYQQQVEEIIAAGDLAKSTLVPRLLRAVAEEVGDLTQRVSLSGGLKIQVNGVDLADLT